MNDLYGFAMPIRPGPPRGVQAPLALATVNPPSLWRAYVGAQGTKWPSLAAVLGPGSGSDSADSRHRLYTDEGSVALGGAVAPVLQRALAASRL